MINMRLYTNTKPRECAGCSKEIPMGAEYWRMSNGREKAVCAECERIVSLAEWSVNESVLKKAKKLWKKIKAAT
jgi:hypothetical protein